MCLELGVYVATVWSTGDVCTALVAQYIFLGISAPLAASTKLNTGVVLGKRS